MAHAEVQAAVAVAKRQLDELDDAIRKELSNAAAVRKAIQLRGAERAALAQAAADLQPRTFELADAVADLDASLECLKGQAADRAAQEAALKVRPGQGHLADGVPDTSDLVSVQACIPCPMSIGSSYDLHHLI